MLSLGINEKASSMNLSSQTPLKQVAHVLAACSIGGCPDLPPFLLVNKAEQRRRDEYAASHPLPPQPKFMERQEPREEPVYVAPPPPPPKKKAKAEPLDMTGFHWDPRRGRFIPDGYIPPRKATAKVTDEEAKLAASLHAANAARAASRPKRAKTVGSRPLVTGDAKPVPGAMLKDEKPIACLIRLLKRPEGVTLQEAATACGWAGPHTAQARIGSDLKKKASLLIEQSEEARGRVYRIAE
jgi:hypothetical protein